MIKLKIDKDLKNDLEKIAEDRFNTPEGILRIGLVLYLQYLNRTDISEELKGENAIDRTEKIIKELAEEYNASIDYIVFCCIDAYRAKVLNMGPKRRLQLSKRNEVLVFIDDIYKGKFICFYSEKSSLDNLQKTFKLKMEENRIKRMEELELYIINAKNKLNKVEKEYELLKKDYSEANKKYSRISGEHQALSVFSIIKLTAKQRINHKEKIDRKNRELAEMAKLTTELDDELKLKSSQLNEIKSDLEYMINCKNKEDIPSAAFIEKYKPIKEGVVNE